MFLDVLFDPTDESSDTLLSCLVLLSLGLDILKLVELPSYIVILGTLSFPELSFEVLSAEVVGLIFTVDLVMMKLARASSVLPFNSYCAALVDILLVSTVSIGGMEESLSKSDIVMDFVSSENKKGDIFTIYGIRSDLKTQSHCTNVVKTAKLRAKID